MRFVGFVSFSIFIILFFSTISTTSASFLRCLTHHSNTSTPFASIVYSPQNTSYSTIWEYSIQNRIFLTSKTPKPKFIITPLHDSHIQAAVICSKKYGLSIRIRSGGHDYEGVSYISYKPFIIIDLRKFDQVIVNKEDNTAWVQSGATIGQVYYRIAEQSNTRAFPAGVCTTLGVGGHIGGGGLGFLWRKYGLAADNVVDAYFIDVKGKLHDRKSMGEDVFWAIRGGGGANFGVIVAWKIKMVPVPSTVTVFNVAKTLEQGATSIFHKWQNVAHKFHENINLRTIIFPIGGEKNRTVKIIFQALYLGTIKDVIPLMRNSFPELGLETKDCNEMSWINSTLSVNGLGGKPIEVLLNRSQPSKKFFKGKSDFVKKAISINDLKGIWKLILSQDKSPMMILEPMGGKMATIPESALPFPHRSGNLYNIQYFSSWSDSSASAKYLESSKRLYNHMTPFVSNNPRSSYLNYKDFDLGTNHGINTSYLDAKIWGEKYFKGNFARLACVKRRVDRKNFFSNKQSIPPICYKRRSRRSRGFIRRDNLLSGVLLP